MFYSDCIVLKLYIAFLWVAMAKQAMLFDFQNMVFKNFQQ